MNTEQKINQTTPLPHREGSGESLYFNPERETMTREQIEAFQLERLKESS